MSNKGDSGNNPERAKPSGAAKTGRRIARVMARAGLASRREAEAWIAAGRVAINGTVITSPAVNIGRKDTVTVDGKPLPQHERTRLFLFHKVRGLVTTTADPEGRPTIFDALPKNLPRLVTVGRLDLNTEGLLLLTNDGGLARVLEHPQTGWLRRYRVRAHGSVTQAQLDALREGITIDGIHYGPIEATLDRAQGANVWLTFAIREGKNREVRNVLGALDLHVNRLIRVSFGPFQLAELAEGAIEEVRTRVLRDQLGKKIAALADADFDAQLAQRRLAPDRKTLPGHPDVRGKRTAKDDGQRAGRASFKTRPSRTPEDGPRQRRMSQDDGPRQRRAPQEDGAPQRKPRPWRSRRRDMPIADRAAETEAPRKSKAGLLTDRKGRRVLVERVQSDQPQESQRQSQKESQQRGRPAARFAKRSKPARDRRQGARPSRPPPPSSPSGGGGRK